MANKNRDDFREKIKLQIAKRAGWLCSYPSCRRLTVGGDIMVGTAAHICAAAPDGPRYDPNQTPEQRRAAENGIWMCRDHGTAIDSKDPEFTVVKLREWKAWAESEARAQVLREKPLVGPAATPTEGELADQLRAATRADLDVFRHSARWPSTEIALTVEVEGFSDPVTPQALATMLATLDDLILVAPPGMGKTTTAFQIAEALSATGRSPIVIPLADWSTEGTPLLQSVLKRPAFRDISEERFRSAATKPGVMLLLDGWNELDGPARKRLTAQVRQLQAELPEVSLLISTRRQALDVPVDGARVNLLPLSETQQHDIAKVLRGEAGLRTLDQAWRTAGVRELVTIPLYLKALITLPEGVPFPTTKEEVLRRFVAAHEGDVQHADLLADVMHGLHGRFLEDLAVTATRALTTTIAVDLARKSVAKTDDLLVDQGQLTEKPQPNTVLETLVGHHVLTRSGDPAGYSFQHQQFQEWYASHFVERLMLVSISDAGSRERLKADVLNQPAWEEPILFACERLARGGAKEQEACAAAILSAFEVDPMLAAEMIFRGDDAVWSRVGGTIAERIRRWHKPRRVDRAVRFMITSGRPEFADLVWPLISHEDDQVHLRALRASRRFRPSILGGDASRKIEALPLEIRKNVLHEIADNSGVDGMDLAMAIAKSAPEPDVKATVVEALAFRRADRHAAEILHSADDRTFDLVVRTELLDDATDEHVKEGIDAARERRRKAGRSPHDRLYAIVYASGKEDMSADVAAIVAEMEFRKDEPGGGHLLYQARNRYPRAVADGILARVRTGNALFYGADDLLAAAGITLEDEQLLALAIADTRRDQRAQAAASILGPQAIGRMIDALLEAKKVVRDPDGKYNEAAAERYRELSERVTHAPASSLIAAIRARSKAAGNEELADLADLIARHPRGDGDRGRPFDDHARAEINALAEDWGGRMLAADATRLQLSSLAGVVVQAPSVHLLPLLKRLLDENLRRYRAVREEAKATGWRPGPARDEATHPLTHEYFRAFQAINTPETAALMRQYMKDEHFGELAAKVLATQWIAANEPKEERAFFRSGIEFSRVAERRATRVRDPAATSAEADAIFGAVESLIAEGTTEEEKKLAITLATIAAALPHGRRDEMMRRLISLAPRRSRAALFRNLTLSGEIIDTELVKSGIAEVFEAAQKESWILWEGYELSNWLQLLPFTSRPGETFDVVRGFPEFKSKENPLEGLIRALGIAPGEEAEKVLFQLADADRRLYASREWREAAFRPRSPAAARQLVDLAASGAFADKGGDLRHLAGEIAGLIASSPDLRGHVYQLLKDGATTAGLELLAYAVAEFPDVDGLVLLIKLEIQHKRSFLSWRTIDSLVTEHIPVEGSQGTYNVAPIPAIELRQRLLAMTTDGGPTDAAARCLRHIDELRDEYGMPDSEPRHPDLTSGRPWPILIPADE
ncbi:MAG: hypothetical protein KJZ83_09580 [Burkholderiaceae bacterium]|nr:hypothetical protein [Burkholderiaceae bacterium]